MHENVRRFFMDGQVKDTDNLVGVKERMIKDHEGRMRDFGFVPVLDMEPQFTLSYNPERENYDFELSVYGVYLGVEESWQVDGIMSGKKILKSTTKSR